MKNVEITHDLHNSNNKYPEIYYEPKKINDLSNTLLIDINAVSSNAPEDIIQKNLKNIMEMYPTLEKKVVLFTKIHNRIIKIDNTTNINVSNIFEYCDMIYSCKAFFSVFSGQSVLASTIKKDNEYPKLHILRNSRTPPYQKGDIYIFDNAEYIYDNY